MADTERLKAKTRLAKALSTRANAISNQNKRDKNRFVGRDNFANNRGYYGPKVFSKGYDPSNSEIGNIQNAKEYEYSHNPDYVISGARWRKSPNADLKGHGK